MTPAVATGMFYEHADLLLHDPLACGDPTLLLDDDDDDADGARPSPTSSLSSSSLSSASSPPPRFETIVTRPAIKTDAVSDVIVLLSRGVQAQRVADIMYAAVTDVSLAAMRRTRPAAPATVHSAVQVNMPTMVTATAIDVPPSAFAADPFDGAGLLGPMPASMQSLVDGEEELVDMSDTAQAVACLDQFQCPESGCTRRFKRKDALTVHYRTHTHCRPFVCEFRVGEHECGQRFASKTAKKRHEASHASEANFPCPKCPKRFKMADALAKHSKTHDTGPAYECEICHRKFNRKDNLDVHRNVHNEIKRYRCPLCPRSFKQRSGLSFHLNSHREIDRPFQVLAANTIGE